MVANAHGAEKNQYTVDPLVAFDLGQKRGVKMVCRLFSKACLCPKQ